MTKKRGKRRPKQRKKRRRRRRPEPRKPSLHVDLTHRLREEGPEALVFSLLRDSAELRPEPEFQGLRFDRVLLAGAMADAFRKYQERLEQAEQEGEEAVADVWGEMEEEVIEVVATPEFRHDFLERLDHLTERLKRTGQRGKLASALFLQTFLKMEGLPWAVCGLVDTLYREAREQVFQEVAEKEALMETLLAGTDVEGFEALWATLQEPERRAVAEEFLQTHPDLRERLEKELDRQIEQATEAIEAGELVLGLFHDEELVRPMAYLAAHIEEQGLVSQEFTEAEAKALAEQFFEFIRRTIAEVVTPTRMMEMKAHLRGILEKRWQAKDKQAPLIHAAIASLGAWERHEDNPILLAEFVCQSRELFTGPKAEDPALIAKFGELVEEIGGGRGSQGSLLDRLRQRFSRR